MKNYFLVFIITFTTFACQKDNGTNQNVNLEAKVELRKGWGAVAADVSGGLSGISTGAWYGSFLGPEGSIIGGMLGGVIGCVGASYAHGKELSDGDNFTLETLPIIKSVPNNNYEIQQINFDLDHISVIHNKLLLESLKLADTTPDDEIYNFIFEKSVVELENLGINFDNFNLDAFKENFRTDFNKLLIGSDISNNPTYNIIMDGFYQNNSTDEEFEAYIEASFSNPNIANLESNFGVAVLHGTYYFWR